MEFLVILMGGILAAALVCVGRDMRKIHKRLAALEEFRARRTERYEELDEQQKQAETQFTKGLANLLNYDPFGGGNVNG